MKNIALVLLLKLIYHCYSYILHNTALTILIKMYIRGHQLANREHFFFTEFEFEVRLPYFKNIEIVVQMLNNCFSLHPNGG